MDGKLIVFEGVEGSGKTTQIQQTSEWLQSLGIFTLVTREPGGTDLGLHLRHLLLEATKHPIADRTELLLYAADRSQHVEQELKPSLAKGAIILCDRYTDSTIAYQGWGRQMSIEMIEQLNNLATGGLQSDLTILLDIDPEFSLKRILAKRKLDRMEQIDLNFHYRVRNGYLSLAKKYPHRIVVVDANQDIAKVTVDIQTLLTHFLKLRA
jgi:dTMP kinase